jgi:hypothetical protein
MVKKQSGSAEHLDWMIIAATDLLSPPTWPPRSIDGKQGVYWKPTPVGTIN